MHQGVFIRCFTLELKSLGHFVAHPVARVSRYGTLNTGKLTENSPTERTGYPVAGKCGDAHAPWRSALGVIPHGAWRHAGCGCRIPDRPKETSAGVPAPLVALRRSDRGNQ